MDAAELWFQGVHVTTSDTDLAWLYNIITNLAQQPIQDAITREVAAQVRTSQHPYVTRPSPASHTFADGPGQVSLHW